MGVLAVAAHAGDLRLCKMLLEYGAALGSRDCLGLTPLHHASFKGRVDIVRLISKKLTLHSHGLTVDFTLDDAAVADSSVSLHSVTASHAAHAESHAEILGTTRTAKTEDAAEATRVDYRRQSILRRPSILLQSMRVMLKRSSVSNTGHTPANRAVARLVNFDACFFTTLDPLSLSGLVAEVVSAGFDASRVSRGTSARPQHSGVVKPSTMKPTSLLHSSVRHVNIGGGAQRRGSESSEHSGRGWAHSSEFVQGPPGWAFTPCATIRPSAAVIHAGGKFVPRVSPLTLAVQVSCDDCQARDVCVCALSSHTPGASPRGNVGALEVRGSRNNAGWDTNIAVRTLSLTGKR